VSHSQGLNLTGPINITVNGQLIGQYTLAMTGSGSPVAQRSSSRQVNWVHSGSSTSGTTMLFPLPNYESGATVTVSGTVTAAPGTTVNNMRIFVTD